MTEKKLETKAAEYSRKCFREIPFDIRAFIRKLAAQAYIDGYKVALSEKDYDMAIKLLNNKHKAKEKKK